MIKFTVDILEVVHEIRTVEIEVADETSVEGIKAAALEAAVQSQDHAVFVDVKDRQILKIKVAP